VKVAIYARVSTSNAGQSVEMQLRDLRDLARRRGFDVFREYCDQASGARDSRPALDAMLTDARQGKFGAILIWKLDRLGRSLSHLVRLLENFEAWGVELISFGEGLDFSTATGKLLYQIISAFAEFERDCIRERVRAGLRNAAAKGKKLGRPRLPVDASTIALLRTQGQSWAAISSSLGIGKGTVQRAFYSLPKNPSSSVPVTLDPAIHPNAISPGPE
jgi:DNA invertase Pin-like site-specific DNA recombinase